MSTLRTNAIVDASGGTTATVNGIPLRPGVLDPENRIINGAFDFWQRGTSFTTAVYGADRWFNGINGGTVTQSRQAFALGETLGSNNPTYFLRLAVSGQSSAANYGVAQQRVEGVRSYAGQTMTILGWARRSSGSGNMSVSFDQNFGTGGSPSAAVLGAGQVVSLTSSWAPFAATFAVPSISGKTLGTNGNDYLAITLFASAGSDYNTNSGSLGLQTIGVDFWGIHIKQGTHTTSAVDLYRQPEMEPELARCQRYFQRWGFGSTNGRMGVGTWNSAASADIFVPLIPEMRISPSISAPNLGQVLDFAVAWHAVTSLVGAIETTNKALNLNLNTATSGAAQGDGAALGGGGVAYDYRADAEY